MLMNVTLTYDIRLDAHECHINITAVFGVCSSKTYFGIYHMSRSNILRTDPIPTEKNILNQ